jgi:hypothetical protein
MNEPTPRPVAGWSQKALFPQKTSPFLAASGAFPVSPVTPFDHQSRRVRKETVP